MFFGVTQPRCGGRDFILRGRSDKTFLGFFEKSSRLFRKGLKSSQLQPSSQPFPERVQIFRHGCDGVFHHVPAFDIFDVDGNGDLQRKQLCDEFPGKWIHHAFAKRAGLPLLSLNPVVLEKHRADVGQSPAEVHFPSIRPLHSRVREIEGHSEILRIDAFQHPHHVPDRAADVVFAPVVLVKPLDADSRFSAAIRPAEPGKSESFEPTAEQLDQAREAQSRMTKQLAARQRQKFETQIARLAENLSLTDLQKSKLTSWLDERLKHLEDIDFTDTAAMEKFMEESKLLNDETLQAQLDGTLTPEEQAALAVHREREYLGKVDAIALKSLSNLQGIIQFEESQRDKVYQLLSESAEESLAAESKNPEIGSVFAEGMGIEMDPYGLCIQQAMTEAMGDPTKCQNGFDQQGMAKTLRKIIADRIDSKVEKLRPVLNDRQLEAYRNELQTKGLGVYGSVLEGMEKGTDGEDVHDTSVILPVN